MVTSTRSLGGKRRASNSKQRLKKAQLSFYPEPADYATLKALSAKTRVPQQVYLREGLAHVLHTYALQLGVEHAAVHDKARATMAQFATVGAQWKAIRRRMQSEGRTAGVKQRR